MRNLVLMLALSVFTCTVQAADWLSWRKVGDATLTGAVYRLYLSASDARRQLYRIRRR